MKLSKFGGGNLPYHSSINLKKKCFKIRLWTCILIWVNLGKDLVEFKLCLIIINSMLDKSVRLSNLLIDFQPVSLFILQQCLSYAYMVEH